MLTGLSKGLGRKTKPKKKVTNNPIYSNSNIPNNLGHINLCKIEII